MKKKIALLLAAVMMLALAACGGKGSTNKTNDGPKNDVPAAPTEEAPTSNHVKDYKIDVPDGFEETEMAGVDACWVNAADNSNINV